MPDVLDAKESEIKEALIDTEDPKIKVLLDVDLDRNLEHGLIKFLKSRKSTLSRKHKDMTSISKDGINHKINIDPSFRPIH